MVDTECPGGHPDCDGNDAAGMGPPYSISCPFDWLPLFLAETNTCRRRFILSFRFGSRGAAYY